MKRSIGTGEWIRRGLGAAMLAGVAAIALGLDTGLLARLSTASTGGIEQAWSASCPANRRGHGTMMAQIPAAGGAMKVADKAPGTLPVEGQLPPLTGAVQWLNSPPLDAQALKGKVVLVDFWTYSCINCLRTLPVKAWAEKYRDQGWW
jgi:hypothetical protein